jgi:hypothetical protein
VLLPFEWQELRVDSSVLDKQGGPLTMGGFAMRMRLVAGTRIRCRKLSGDGRVEWVPLNLFPAGRG